jgi:hypothetical protein
MRTGSKSCLISGQINPSLPLNTHHPRLKMLVVDGWSKEKPTKGYQGIKEEGTHRYDMNSRGERFH